jgi:hypothetical protein
MKILYVFVTHLFFLSSLFAQTLEIKGVVKDSANHPLVATSVMLLEPDSSLVDFTQTGADGSFIFKKIAVGKYLLKMNYVGYLPLTLVVPEESGKVDLGAIIMEEMDTRLMEVVIREAKAPMMIRGDTIEYDASQFKVPQGSSLEDLLRRLPGVVVDKDGNIRAEGLNVTRLTVEGKTFFSDDPKMATKNLPAEGISKVQVFDRKSEEQKLMNDKSVSEEKEMNVLLKDDFKKGGFGRITAGIGDINRKELKGNYNRFDTKQQFSVIGVGNNTGRNGLGWDDYEDFMGSSAWVANIFGLDYGFSSSGGVRMMSFGGGNADELESKVSDVFFDQNRGGFPSSIITGVNYNYDQNKDKLSGRYLFNRKGNIRNMVASSQNFLPTQISLNQSNTDFDDLSTAHKAELMYERELDSLTSVMVSASYTNVDKQNILERFSSFSVDDNVKISDNFNINNAEFDGQLLQSLAVLRKRFQKKGRFLGVNASFVNTNINSLTRNDADLRFFNAMSGMDSLSALRQNISTDANKTQWKANLMFNEPLNKVFFLNTFYNFRTWTQVGDFVATDNENGESKINSNLSREYENGVMAQRVGTTLKYTKSGFNISAGYGYQDMLLRGNYIGIENSGLMGSINQRFGTWLSMGDVSYQINRSTSASINYYKTVDEPKLESLLPLVNNLNPLFITIGNQELLPEIGHTGSINFRKSWPVQGVSMYFSGSYVNYETQITQRQTVDENLITISQPINFDGGSSFNAWFNFSAPIIAGKIRASFYNSAMRRQSFTIINDVVNNTISSSISPNLNMDFTFSDRFALFTGVSYGVTNTAYDINTSQNQQIIRYSYNFQLNVNPFKGFFISGRFVQSFFKNERFGENVDVPILNLSISQQVLKGNKGEIRLSMYDGFNQNRQINQSASQNFVSESVTNALARYYMLSFTYNIRGVNNNVTKREY